MMKSETRISPCQRSLTVSKLAIGIVASSLLLGLSFTVEGTAWIAWFAWVPFLYVCVELSTWSRFLVGYAFGITSLLATNIWAFSTPGMGLVQAVLLLLVFSLFPAVWSISLGLFAVQRHWGLLFAAASWSALEYLRGHFGILANPWETAAQTQAGFLMLAQIASVSGEAGVGLLLIFANLLLVWSLFDRCWTVMHSSWLAVFIAVLGYGGWLLSQNPGTLLPLRVGVVQPNFTVAEIQSPTEQNLRFSRLQKLTLSIREQSPDLVVWPETALKNLRYDPMLQRRMRQLIDQIGSPILTGASEFRPARLSLNKTQENLNAAYWLPVERTSPPAPYYKNILLPFAEYLPFSRWLTWPKSVIPVQFNSTAGNRQQIFTTKNGLKLSVLICWENLFTDYVKKTATDIDLLIHLVNLNWFAHPMVAEIQNRANIFRAIENGRPIVVVSNNGPSRILDAFGRLSKEIAKINTASARVVTIPAGHPTLYSLYGNWFYITITIVLLVSLPAGLYVRQQSLS